MPKIKIVYKKKDVKSISLETKGSIDATAKMVAELAHGKGISEIQIT